MMRPAAGIKHVFKIPAKAHRLIVRSWFGFIEKWCLTQLLQVHIYLRGIVFRQSFGEVVNDAQHRAGIELRGMCRQHQPDREIL